MALKANSKAAALPESEEEADFAIFQMTEADLKLLIRDAVESALGSLIEDWNLEQRTIDHGKTATQENMAIETGTFVSKNESETFCIVLEESGVQPNGHLLKISTGDQLHDFATPQSEKPNPRQTTGEGTSGEEELKPWCLRLRSRKGGGK